MSNLEDHMAEQAQITAEWEDLCVRRAEGDIHTRCAPAWAWEIIDSVLADRAAWRNTSRGPPDIGRAWLAMNLASSGVTYDHMERNPIYEDDERLTEEVGQ